MSEPTDHLLYKPAVGMLALGAVAAVFATVLHLNEADPHPVDLTVPPVVGAVFILMLFSIFRNPERVRGTMAFGFMAVLVAMMIPVWYFTIEAFGNPEIQLVDTLPPVTAALFPLTLGLSLFLRQRSAIQLALFAWVVIAAPVLGYLVLNPEEMLTPRGRDVAITLGPIMAAALFMVPFHAQLQRQVAVLQLQKTDLKGQAERDAMTGLYNRGAGEGFLDRLIGRAEPNAALILFDIDRFKAINDSLGHAVGDEVLREIVRRCDTRVRRDDRFIRWGGEEFLIIADGVDEDGAHRIAEALRQMVSGEPIAEAGIVTASFGVATPVQGDDAASVMQRADEALYAAKAAGRNQVA